MKKKKTRTFAGIFARGLLVFLPLVGSIACVWIFLSWLDRILGLPYPGAGIAILVGAIFVTGLVSQNLGGARIIRSAEKHLSRVPVLSLLYTSIKDLLSAFVGDKKSFDKPVSIDLDESGNIRAFGFVTCERFDDLELQGFVAVYLPQAYNFAGNILLVPRTRVRHVDADPAQFMAFIVSGGVSDMKAAQTILADGSLLSTLRR